MKPSENNYPWGDHLRYNSLAGRLREKFGERIQKVSVNAGFTCPNRDGSLGFGGCTYCLGDSFVPSYCRDHKDLKTQIDEGIEFQRFRYRRVSKYFAYLQAYTNTYAPVKKLKSIYDEILSHPLIYGLCISTRPDCINDEILDLLEKLSESYPVFIELGIESCYDRTLAIINRRHTFDQSEEAILRLSKRHIPVTVHLIFGLPGESIQDMLNEASILSSLPVTSVKFHQLQIFYHAPVYSLYKFSPELFCLFTLESYSEFIADILERLNPEISIERMAAEVPLAYQLVNGWDHVRVGQVAIKIESVMELRKTCQGIKFKKFLKNPVSNNYN